MGKGDETDDTLVTKVRAKLADGSLPPDEPVKNWVGLGSGQPCTVCGNAILRAQVEYEPEMADGRRFKMHIGCRGLWVAERYLLDLARRGRRKA